MSELSVCELDVQCGELLPERETLGTLGLNINIDAASSIVVGNQLGLNIAVLANGVTQSVTQIGHFSA